MIMVLSQALDLLPCRDPVDGQHPFSTLINRIEQTLGSSLNGVRICIKRWFGAGMSLLPLMINEPG
jgi:hypothetical protein